MPSSMARLSVVIDELTLTLMLFIPTKLRVIVSPGEAAIENLPAESDVTDLFPSVTVTPCKGSLVLLRTTTPLMTFCCARAKKLSKSKGKKKWTFLIMLEDLMRD